MCKVSFFLYFNKLLILLKSSFGHSCYGGFGRKRSDPTLTLDISQDNEASQNQQQAGPLMKMFPQTNPQLAHSETQQQQLFEQEKEFKMIVLSTMNQVVEETLKRIAGEFEK